MSISVTGVKKQKQKNSFGNCKTNIFGIPNFPKRKKKTIMINIYKNANRRFNLKCGTMYKVSLINMGTCNKTISN